MAWTNRYSPQREGRNQGRAGIFGGTLMRFPFMSLFQNRLQRPGRIQLPRLQQPRVGSAPPIEERYGRRAALPFAPPADEAPATGEPLLMPGGPQMTPKPSPPMGGAGMPFGPADAVPPGMRPPPAPAQGIGEAAYLPPDQGQRLGMIAPQDVRRRSF